MKFILWFALILAVIHLLRANSAALRRSAMPPAPPSPQPAPSTAIESMVQCGYCGIHLPASEALPAVGGAQFCCEEHRLRATGA